MSFADWFELNRYSNYFTLATVVVSGIVSLIISAIYYRKGNRNSLKMTVIHPIIRILNDGYSRKNYENLCELVKDYSSRYLNKKEMETINDLLDKYKAVSVYNDAAVTADILFSYFQYKLKKNKINPKPVPVEYDGEFVYSDYPPDLWYLSEDLEKVFKRYDLDYELEECTENVISLYRYYCKKYYTSQTIKFFDDYTLQEVLKKSEIRKKWDEKFFEVEKAKETFFGLKIVRKEKL